MILSAFPTKEAFYANYWGKKPFIVRNFIPTEVIEGLVDGDTLAALSLEQEIKSRIVKTNKAGNEWVCEHGPFDEDYYDTIGEHNWSLLVQNVEQYHTETANLLPFFHLSPRWLLDDVMVSFSAPGGSVGPHTDSYHTFLVQGMGKREWKVSAEQVHDKRYVDNPDMKILEQGFEGETFEVTTGDVIYMPPFFGHEGKTLEAAMTFSVGFLGPKLSEMIGCYAQYLEDNEELDTRYLGQSLDADSAGFTIGRATQLDIQERILSSIQSEQFGSWMASYFSNPSHEAIEGIGPVSSDDLFSQLKAGATLSRAEQHKIAIIKTSTGSYSLAIYGESINVSENQATILDKLNNNQEITYRDISQSKDLNEAATLIAALYEQNVLNLPVIDCK